MACIEELDHKDCIGLQSTNPPHTQCHRNRWLNKDCWISQSDRRLGNSCLFVCHLEDKTLLRPRTGLTQAGGHQFIQDLSCCCLQTRVSKYMMMECWRWGFFPPHRSNRRKSSKQIQLSICWACAHDYTFFVRHCGRADLLADAGLTTGQTGPAEKPASKAMFRDYVSTCMLSRCCPL